MFDISLQDLNKPYQLADPDVSILAENALTILPAFKYSNVSFN